MCTKGQGVACALREGAAGSQGVLAHPPATNSSAATGTVCGGGEWRVTHHRMGFMGHTRALYLASALACAMAFPVLQNSSAQHRVHALQALLPAPLLTLSVPPVASLAPVLGAISSLPAGGPPLYACLYVESDGAATVVTGPKPLASPASAVAVDSAGAFSFPAWASDAVYDPTASAFWGVVTAAGCPAALSAPALPASLAATATAIARVARASSAGITVTSFAPLPLAGAGATAIAGMVTGLPLDAVALQALLYFGATAQAFTCAGPGLPLAQAAGSAQFAFPLTPALLASPVLTVVILPAALDVAAAGVCGQGLPGAPLPAGVLGAVLVSASLDRTSALSPALLAELLRPTTPTASASATPAPGSEGTPAAGSEGDPAAGSEGAPAAAEPLLPPEGEGEAEAVAEAEAASATGTDSSSASPSASPTGTDSPSLSASGSATPSKSARGAPFQIQEQSGAAAQAGRAAAYMGLAVLLLALAF